MTYALLLSAAQCHSPFAHLQHIQTQTEKDIRHAQSCAYRVISTQSHDYTLEGLRLPAPMPCRLTLSYTLHSYRRRGPSSHALLYRRHSRGGRTMVLYCSGRLMMKSWMLADRAAFSMSTDEYAPVLFKI